MDTADLGPAMQSSAMEDQARSAKERIDALERRVADLEKRMNIVFRRGRGESKAS